MVYRMTPALSGSISGKDLLSSAKDSLAHVTSAAVDHSVIVGSAVVGAAAIGLGALGASFLLDQAIGIPNHKHFRSPFHPSSTSTVIEPPQLPLVVPEPITRKAMTAEIRRDLHNARMEAQKTMDTLQFLKGKLEKLESENKQLNHMIDEKHNRLVSLSNERKSVDGKLAKVNPPSTNMGDDRELAEDMKYNVAVIEAATQRTEFLLKKISTEQEAVNQLLQTSLSRLDHRLEAVHQEASDVKVDLLATGQQKDYALQALSPACNNQGLLSSVVSEIASRKVEVPKEGARSSASLRPFSELKQRLNADYMSRSGATLPSHHSHVRETVQALERGPFNIDTVINSLPSRADIYQRNYDNSKISTTIPEVAEHKETSSPINSFNKEKAIEDMSSVEPSEISQSQSNLKIRSSSSKKALETLGACFGVPKKSSKTDLPVEKTFRKLSISPSREETSVVATPFVGPSAKQQQSKESLVETVVSTAVNQ